MLPHTPSRRSNPRPPPCVARNTHHQTQFLYGGRSGAALGSAVSLIGTVPSALKPIPPAGGCPRSAPRSYGLTKLGLALTREDTEVGTGCLLFKMASAEDTFDPTAVFDEDMGANWDGNDISMFDSSLDQGMLFNTPNMFEDAFGNSPAAATPQFAVDSPARQFTQQTDQKPPPKTQNSLQPRAAVSSASPESSSQDSSSESSSRRKRKTSSNSSPSALFDAIEMRDTGKSTKKGQNNATGASQNGLRDSALSFGAAALSLEQDDNAVNDSMARHFDFESAASSPGAFGMSASNQAITGSQMMPRSTNGATIPPVWLLSRYLKYVR